jgi:parallel beta-helix repeat protein
VAKSTYGLRLHACNNNTISGNTITENTLYGVRLVSSSHNRVSGNNITANNGHGIWLHESSGNKFSGNDIAYSTYGISLEGSFNNTISHNNFVNNTQQLKSSSSTNTWDDGAEGNFWSDYEERYPDAEELDDSGIWDTPYVIDENNQDNYPLMEPWTPAPPIPTTIEGLKTKIEELGSEGEIDNQGIVRSLIAKLNVAQKLVDKGKIGEAKRILEEDFIAQVQNLANIHITAEAADSLIESAEYILSHL